jgi:hypothetical protein
VCLIGHHHQQKKWQKNIQSGETKNWENTRIERILELSEWLSDESRFVLFLDMRTIIIYADEKLIRIRLFRNLFVSTFYTHVEKVLTKRFWEKRKIIKPTTPINWDYIIMRFWNKSGTPTDSNCDWLLQNQSKPTQYFSMVYP